MFPGCVLGLSDHTPGYSAVLGAVALGARIVGNLPTPMTVKAQTWFSLTPARWRAMVDAAELTYAGQWHQA